MNTLQTLTDAGARAVAEYADRLGRRLDGLGGRLCEAVARAVGEAVAGAVEAAVRAALDEFAAGQAPAGRYDPYAEAYPRYWEDQGDGWGTTEDGYDSPPASSTGYRPAAASNSGDATRRRWLHVALLAG